MKIPSPEQRLCFKHNKPIQPSKWLEGYRYRGCFKCNQEFCTAPEVQKKRTLEWETNFISCTKHPDRRCKRSLFLHSRRRLCSSCHLRTSDGSLSNTHKRRRNQEEYKRSMKRRSVGKHSTSLQGLKLFQRSTGFNLGV